MEDEELDAIRRKKLEELRLMQQQQTVMEEQKEVVEAQRQMILRRVLTPPARERLGRIRTARPEMAMTIEDQLIALAQSGRINRQIDDNDLRIILDKLVPKKREIKIQRK